MGGGFRRPNLGTRISYYRCSLPGLAEFAAYRREEPTEATVGSATNIAESACDQIWRRERDSNPRYSLTRIHTFQACSLSHSDISPLFGIIPAMHAQRMRRGPRTLPSAPARLKDCRQSEPRRHANRPQHADPVAQWRSPNRAIRCPIRCWRASGAPRYSPS